MDHLPRASADFVYLEIPYFFDPDCPYIYDNNTWKTYPIRAGWDFRALEEGDYTNRGRNTPDQAASLLQAWLYFGMIHCVTGMPIETSDFILINVQGSQVVSLRNLRHHLTRWRMAVRLWPKEEEFSRTADIIFSIKKMTDIVARYVVRETPMSNALMFSITILHRTLMCAQKSILTHSNFDLEIWYLQGCREIIDRQLYNQGWCRRDVTRHHQGQSCLAMYYAITLGQRLVHRDHSKCSEEECLALQVDHATYRTQHVSCGCNCSHLGVNVQEICSLIERDLTPVLKLTSSNSGEVPKVDVLSGQEYVCISHVWANGFGNLHANSLPLCQLIRLQNHVNNLYSCRFRDGNVPFWIDTLCIPVQEVNIATRRRAIIGMRKVYEEAAKVLVVDVELLKSRTVGASHEEIAMRISCSVWWSRLWTLQEAIFAKELHFQFQDQALNGKDLVERSDVAHDLCSMLGWTASEQIAYEGLAYLREIYAFKSSVADSRARFILQAVNWRSTSWKSDEAVCLAAILGLNVQEILSTPDADRLQRFILMQCFFPSISLFYSGAKMEVDGFRWAPKTFVFSQTGLLQEFQQNPEHGGSRFELPSTLARADELGLYVQFPGFRLMGNFRGCSRGRGRGLFRDVSNGFWYDIRMVKNTIAKPFLHVSLHDIPNVAIVLYRRPDVGWENYYGILVSIYKDENGVMFSQLVSRVSLDQWGLMDLHDLGTLLGIKEPMWAESISLAEDQCWCIG